MSVGTCILNYLSMIHFGGGTTTFWKGLGWSMVAGVLHLAASSGPVEPLEEIAARSDWVLCGEVVEIGVAEPQPGNLISRVLFTNVVAWKGMVSNRFELNLPGGTLGRRRLVLAGAPNFCLNQQWVVFAMKNQSGEAILAHPIQGALQVNWKTGERVGGGANPRPGIDVNPSGSPPSGIPLPKFLQLIQSVNQ